MSEERQNLIVIDLEVRVFEAIFGYYVAHWIEDRTLLFLDTLAIRRGGRESIVIVTEKYSST